MAAWKYCIKTQYSKPLLNQSTILGQSYTSTMNERTDIITAMWVEVTLMLQPAIGWLQALVALAVNAVSQEVAARVLTMPFERRRSKD
jgi:hypothetical protein